MRTKQNKVDFINTLKTELKHREMLADFYNTKFWAIVEKFNGKVYNKRFLTTLNEEMQKVNVLLSAKFENQSRNVYSNYKENIIVTIILCCRFDKFNYQDKENLYVNIVLDFGEMRINAEKSKNEKYTIAWYENFVKTTEENKSIIKGYDKFLKVAEKIQNEISKYKDLPFRFRQNIEFNELFYLK